ncbi:hypothetical protein ACEU2D_20145 [Brevibacillus laterosporus]|uniref:hypothetical protein n=1 Tax=Brevibacillus laterosporus TaxID=1465 RepID=UPI0035A68C1D
MNKKKRDFKPSQSQKRLLNLLNIEYAPELDYDAVGDLLVSHGFPKNGLPYDTHSSKVKKWSDEKLFMMAIKEKHMREEHNMVWCIVCENYHEYKKEH